jgi:exonuclease SbcD
MNSLRYIHAADLHLDTPFLGLSRTDAGEALQAQLRDATFTALQRLFDLCERLRPDFLILAGDIYNQEEHSVKAQLALLPAPAGLRHPRFLGPRQP